MSLIATLPEHDPPLQQYSETQAALPYNSLYIGGVYNGTYEDTPVSTEPLWPFAKVPKFNWLKTPPKYEPVPFEAADNPSAEGWYEKDASDNYVLSTDTAADENKTYYKEIPPKYEPVPFEAADNPSAEGWYEKDASDNYVLSTDTAADENKTYYKEIPPEIINGCYWTNGEDCITDLSQFKDLVLGVQDNSQELNNNYTEPDADYNRTRIVTNYKAGFDFGFIKKSSYNDEQDYTEAVANWNETWKKYYPDTVSPQELFNEDDASTDTTYMDFSDIVVYRKADPEIRYVTPGVYVNDYKAVPYACSSGLILYNNDDAIDVTANAWHHNVDKTSLYHMENTHEYGQMYGAVSMRLPFYFGEATADIVVSGVDNNSLESTLFIENKNPVILNSASLILAINYTYKQHVGADGTTYWSWDKTSVDEKCWFGHVLARYSAGKVTIDNAELNVNVAQVQTYYVTGDVNSGIKFAWPIWGHSQTRMIYPEMVDQTHINDKDAFIVEPVPTAELADTRLVYFDRNDTAKSLHLFKVVENARIPDLGNDTGNFTFRIDAVANDSFLYFAKKQFNSDQQEVLMDYYIPGIAWGDPGNTTGYMSTASQSPVLEVDWKPVARRFPTSVLESFSDKNTKNVQHRFYKSDKSLVHNVNYVLNDIDFDNLTQTITLKFPNCDYTLYYDSATEVTIGVSNQQLVNNAFEEVDVLTCAGAKENVVMLVLLKLNYKNNRAKFIKLSDYTLVSSDGNNCVITNGTNQITYAINQQDVILPKTGAEVSVVPMPGGQHVKIEGKTLIQCAAYLKAVYNGTINGSMVSFEWQGMTFTWDLSNVVDTGISVLSTDIRTPDKTKVIGKLRTEGQYQL